MKFQLICFTLITFCITNSLSAACDDASMTTNATCIANTTCEWKAKSTGNCGDTTTNEAGTNCVGLTTSATCNGKCKYTETDTTAHTGTCAAGTKLQDGASGKYPYRQAERRHHLLPSRPAPAVRKRQGPY